MGMSVRIVDGLEENIKITTPMDLKLANMLWEDRK
jgi:2-C-methyl-D-erythritol 4-phosphate cytidylyltransferase